MKANIPDTLQQTVDEVFALYDHYGANDYIGEPVSQIEHMTQSAQLAEIEGYDEDVTLAAFFHDIGHFCVKAGGADQMGDYGVRQHEKIGAHYLRSKGFSDKIAKLVENHVQAKRYLTYKYPSYYEKLSEASKQTLVYQGGRMTRQEAEAFEKDPLFNLSIRLREWDELAKEEQVPVPDLQYLKEMALQHLERQQQG